MIEAFRTKDWDAWNRYADYMSDMLKNLLRVEADLVFYGHFTALDVSRMKPMERRFHIDEINRRNEEIAKARQGG